MLVIDGWGIYGEIALRWLSLDLTDKSTMVQVMAWCPRQQAITWTNVDPDLCLHMVSLRHNELSVKTVLCFVNIVTTDGLMSNSPQAPRALFNIKTIFPHMVLPL